MKILLLSEIQVYPTLSGGQIRSGAFARALAESGHEVSIYSFTGRKKDYLEKKPDFGCYRVLSCCAS